MPSAGAPILWTVSRSISYRRNTYAPRPQSPTGLTRRIPQPTGSFLITSRKPRNDIGLSGGFDNHPFLWNFRDFVAEQPWARQNSRPRGKSVPLRRAAFRLGLSTTIRWWSSTSPIRLRCSWRRGRTSIQADNVQTELNMDLAVRNHHDHPGDDCVGV